MFNRILLAMAACLIVLGFATVGCTLEARNVGGPSTAAASRGSSSGTTYVTLDEPARLPDVTIGPGTYIFERGWPSARTMAAVRGHYNPVGTAVLVWSLDRANLCFMAFTTNLVKRPMPAGASQETLSMDVPADLFVSFGDAAPGEPKPITAWYPENESIGYEFIYRSEEP